MKTLSLKLPVELDLQLTLKAQRNRLTKSEVVRKALKAYLNNQEQVSKGPFLELVEELVGFVEGPDDLSRNPLYMKDLGNNPHGLLGCAHGRATHERRHHQP